MSYGNISKSKYCESNHHWPKNHLLKGALGGSDVLLYSLKYIEIKNEHYISSIHLLVQFIYKSEGMEQLTGDRELLLHG